MKENLGIAPCSVVHVGVRYGMLTVLSERTADWFRYLTCRCDCGKIIERKLHNIKKSPFASCGCQSNRIRAENSSHTQFDPTKYVQKRCGRLLVTGLDFDLSRKHQKYRLVCMCDCGAQTLIAPAAFVNQTTKSCGCIATESSIANGHATIDHGHSVTGVIDGLQPIYTQWLWIRRTVAVGWRTGAHRVCHEFDPRWEDYSEFYKDFGDIKVSECIRRRDRQLPWSRENCYVARGSRTKIYPAQGSQNES